MNKQYKFLSFFAIGLLAISLVFTACKKDDDDASSGIELLSFGPSPALRGSELIIIGTGLDAVSAVVLTNNVRVTSFTSKSAERITLTIPEETVDGPITLETAQGDITSKTILTISEPIVLTSFSPQVVRPGDVLTIQGDYLNLIKSVTFANNVGVGDTLFTTHTRESIELAVPESAQTGLIVLSNGAAMPILVESETQLEVTVPKSTQLTPNPVKAGTLLTIDGTDLDLAKQVVFEGSSPVTDFVSQSATKIEVMVPEDAHDGPLVLIPASFVEIASEQDLIMVVPTISDITPDPVKNGKNVTITGTNLDLVIRVTFGGGKVGPILSKTETEMVVRVPVNATEDVVTLLTAADKTVTSSGVLELVKPVVEAINPTEAQFGDEITITGTDLDLVTRVLFSGDVEAPVNSALETSVTVDIPIGTMTGPISVVTINGSAVTSNFDLTILVSTNAVITSMPDMAAPGDLISIEGENLDELSEVIFPGDVPATMFGQKTATLIEVFIPLATATGVGNIKFITFTGEEFFSPPINIQGVDPVDDPSLVFFNFDGLDLWWGDTGGIENDPSLSLDGSNYFRVNGSLSGWTGFFWRNGGDNFPGATIGTSISSYVLKFDINVLDPITGGEFAWRLKGSDGDFWYSWKPWEATGSYATDGWITVTIPLDGFSDGGGPIPNLANITEDFGVAFNNGDSMVNACIDNVRFELQ